LGGEKAGKGLRTPRVPHPAGSAAFGRVVIASETDTVSGILPERRKPCRPGTSVISGAPPQRVDSPSIHRAA
jgi:hypothetical protein